MKENRLKHLYVEELKDIYSAEKSNSESSAKVGWGRNFARAAGWVRGTFDKHVARLEQIFEALGESPKGKKCKGMEGLVAEGAEMIEDDLVPAELDAGLVSAAQRVEHYEIAAYGCVCAYASTRRGCFCP
jgi:ferritin-like metal-binding protein YciE